MDNYLKIASKAVPVFAIIVLLFVVLEQAIEINQLKQINVERIIFGCKHYSTGGDNEKN